MKKLLVSVSVFAAAGMLATAVPASAAPVVIYSTSTTAATDMIHQNAYVWQINGISLGNNTITSAVLTFNGFFNWTTYSADPYNILWADLFDRSNYSTAGVYSAQDDTNTGTLGQSDVLDAFRFSGGTNLSVVGTGSGRLVPSAGTYLGSSTNTADSTVNGYGNPSGDTANNQGLTGVGPTGAFGTQAVTWTLTITNSTALTALANYIANGGDIAIGLDSDCHFGDTSIGFQIFGTPNTTQAAVPEPGTLALLGTGIVAAIRRRRAARRA